MATWPSGEDVEEETLQLGEELGRGGQGEVVRVASLGPALVFKRYTVKNADAAALKNLVELPTILTLSERELLHRQTAWPLARVMRQGQLSGFLMRRIPDTFAAANTTGSVKERQLQYLLYQRRPVWGDIVPDKVSIEARLHIAYESARLIHLLHDKSLIVGDISMSNILWAPGEPPAIFLIDCDGIRVRGTRAVLPQVDTPDWEDPKLPFSGPDRDSDRYKLALLVGRVLSQNPYIAPSEELVLLDGVPAKVAAEVRTLWLQAARPHGTRPDAWRWMVSLSEIGRMPDA